MFILNWFLVQLFLYARFFIYIYFFSAEQVDSRIDAFLDEFGELLTSMSNEDFKIQVIDTTVGFNGVIFATVQTRVLNYYDRLVSVLNLP